MADVARSHGGDGGNEPPYGPPYNLRTGCESCIPRFTTKVGKKFLHYFDLQRYHNIEYWEGIKQGIQSDCANRYKDRKTKLKKHFDKVGGYDNTERAKTKPPEGMNPDAWVQVIEELFTTPTYQKRSQANSANRSKQLYGSYHGTQSYAQRRYTEVQETGVAKHVEGWREMHCKGSSGWYNEMAETHWVSACLV
ncbi:hypothetical protein E3N88_02323 [Mikania micrantha]|uniref:Uncharacterized protein n=1 Tax=Mikania micrantha TaxID=192012 RepID=A0A5N6Q5X5_9ASTR|nr:hypothetical protein E3N88_02323 [Mikania micrantha]